MVKKILGIAEGACLAILLVDCRVVSQSAAPPSEAVNDTRASQAVVATTAPTEVNTPTTEETVAVAEVKPANEDVAIARQQGIVELPKLENQLAEGEYYWNQLLGRDSIMPIYEPEFVSAGQAPYDDDELVIGLEINGQAKAYAIGPLNGREMVNDTLGGRPILVTW